MSTEDLTCIERLEEGAESGQWDARVIEHIPELNAEPDDIIIVRPEHPEYPVLVVHRFGPEALAVIEEHRHCLSGRHDHTGEEALHV